MSGVLQTAKLDWQSGPVVRSSQFNDIYFSDLDGLAETRHVFISGNNIVEKFSKLASTMPHENFSIGELGFGTGLNFLATWAEWLKCGHNKGHLTYITTEAFPLSADDFRSAQEKISQNWPELSVLSDKLNQAYPPLISGSHTLLIAENITLQLMLGDAAEGLAKLTGEVDCWFLDGFSPSTNPEMWSAELFRLMAQHSHKATSLATFSVAGFVRRGLAEVGFEVQKTDGFARKKHMLIGQHTGEKTEAGKYKPYYSYKNLTPHKGKRALVVGAGIAGASLAWHLKQSGFDVTVIDKQGIASGASGNPAGIVMPRLDLDQNSDAQLYLHAWLYTANLIKKLEVASGRKILTHPGGVRLAHNETEAKKHQKLLKQPVGITNLIRSLSNEEAERLSGLSFSYPVDDNHLSYEIGGTISPRALIQALLSDAQFHQAEFISYVQDPVTHEIQATIAEGNQTAIISADHLFIATSVHADQYLHSSTCTASLGQLEVIDSPTPNCAISYGPYLAPYENKCVVGATYKNIPLASAPSVSLECQEKNLRAASSLLPDFPIIKEDCFSRASIRCFTNDRHPIAGPLPNWSFYHQHYEKLSVKRDNDLPDGTYTPNTYLLTALGSRGLVTAPFCAAFICAIASGRPNPLDLDKQHLIHPARFLVRQEKRRS